jgi:methyl-accepting chemotaxis protein
MNLLSRCRLRTKLAMLLGLSTIALIVSIVAGASLMHQRMIDDRIDKLRAVVQSAIGFAQSLERQVTAGRITREQAMAQFRDDLHTMRFDAGSNYVLAQTPEGLVVMHGGDPTREGKPTASKDADGRSSAELARDVMRSADDGVISYLALKPGAAKPTPKLSYVARFTPWNLVFIAGAWTDDLEASYQGSLWRLSSIGGAIVLVTLLTAWLVNRDISGSLGRLKLAMERLAKGDLLTEIPGTTRRDEVGAMAGSVLVFKQHMAQEEQLATVQEQERVAAATEKHAALAAMADKIETETDTALHEVAARTTTMTTIADEMAASAARTGTSAQSAATASAQALATAQTVASAAEQLTASIHEISGQVAQSTEVVGRAVTAGSETRRTIEALNEQVARIGAVADMIGEIAAKTNLLALNATIEAARAGDAGKGFAVVASEVKALATQTAHSTQEIAQHIAQVRSATGASVAAVERIEQTIGEINAISGSIAAAVEEQGAATAEIARNVAETASAAHEMASRTADVSTEAEQTGTHAAEVRENAAGLNTAVGELRHSVIRVVRTSTSEVDRRHHVRHVTNLSCRLSAPGQGIHNSRVSDLSEAGAAITDAPSLSIGARGSLEVDRIAMPLPFVVRSTDGNTLRVGFELDAAGSSRLIDALVNIGMQQAA